MAEACPAGEGRNEAGVAGKGTPGSTSEAGAAGKVWGVQGAAGEEAAGEEGGAAEGEEGAAAGEEGTEEAAGAGEEEEVEGAGIGVDGEPSERIGSGMCSGGSLGLRPTDGPGLGRESRVARGTPLKRKE